MNIELQKFAAQHAEMVAGLAKPGAEIISSLTPQTMHLLHMAVGISGEVGELQEGILRKNEDNILEELGDLMFYLRGFYQGIDWADTIDEASLPCTSTLAVAGNMDMLVVYSSQLLDKVKKHAIYAKPITAADEGTMALLADKIMGRCLDIGGFYLYSKLDMLQHNYSKLSERYKGLQYSDQAAIDRADKTGTEN